MAPRIRPSVDTSLLNEAALHALKNGYKFVEVEGQLTLQKNRKPVTISLASRHALVMTLGELQAYCAGLHRLGLLPGINIDFSESTAAVPPVGFTGDLDLFMERVATRYHQA